VTFLDTPFEPGEVVGGRYRIERIVACGGMGVIVAARHIELEEMVAIKFLKGEFAAKPEVVGRFAREAKAAAKIKCEYTATVHDVGISPERGPYIVMEYLEGEDLEHVLAADGRMPFALAAELIMQAGEALANAHAKGIIHRDIKPANLFVVKNDHDVPVIKVLDFGVSKAALTGNVFGGAISLVKTQSLVGSPVYMSPEQLRFGNQDVAFTSDVWSLGAVLYELVSGSTAFTGATITQLCAAVLEVDPVPVGERVELPAGLADTIMRCLEKDPSRRWQSVAELVVALAPYAPTRACMMVDRVVALSRRAGLLRSDFAVPESASPSVTLALPKSPAKAFDPVSLASLPAFTVSRATPTPPPRSLVETQVESTAGLTVEPGRPHRASRARLLALAACAAAVVLAVAIFGLRRSTHAEPAVAATPPPAVTVLPPPTSAAPP
jgi:serine/threonine-protein kinase